MTRPRRCVYCGHPCFGQTCRAHQDLPEQDPNRTSLLRIPPEKKKNRRKSFVERWATA